MISIHLLSTRTPLTTMTTTKKRCVPFFPPPQKVPSPTSAVCLPYSRARILTQTNTQVDLQITLSNGPTLSTARSDTSTSISPLQPNDVAREKGVGSSSSTEKRKAKEEGGEPLALFPWLPSPSRSVYYQPYIIPASIAFLFLLFLILYAADGGEGGMIVNGLIPCLIAIIMVIPSILYSYRLSLKNARALFLFLFPLVCMRLRAPFCDRTKTVRTFYTAKSLPLPSPACSSLRHASH